MFSSWTPWEVIAVVTLCVPVVGAAAVAIIFAVKGKDKEALDALDEDRPHNPLQPPDKKGPP